MGYIYPVSSRSSTGRLPTRNLPPADGRFTSHAPPHPTRKLTPIQASSLNALFQPARSFLYIYLGTPDVHCASFPTDRREEERGAEVW